MYILGKLFGALFGGLIAGPLGFLLGLMVGHAFDKGLQLNVHLGPRVDFAEAVFFKTTFKMMGYIAKADGRVSEQEIANARKIMSQLQLDARQKQQAIQFFNQGKSGQFNWESTIDHFIRYCGSQKQLVHLFVDIQVQAALVDGLESHAKHYLLVRLCEKLQVNVVFKQRQRQSRPQQRTVADELKEAYRLLGVSPQADKQQIKRAYRQLVSQNHPDKLVAKGLPKAMIQMATKRMQKIQKAYELVSNAKK